MTRPRPALKADRGRLSWRGDREHPFDFPVSPLQPLREAFHESVIQGEVRRCVGYPRVEPGSDVGHHQVTAVRADFADLEDLGYLTPAERARAAHQRAGELAGARLAGQP